MTTVIPVATEPFRVTFRRVEHEEQYVAESVVGSAVITRVSPNGAACDYEIETSLNGQNTRLFYTNPTLADAKTRVRSLMMSHAQRLSRNSG